MRTPIYTNKFKKELEKCKRRNLKMSEIKEVMALLIANKPLEPKHKNHPLHGDYLGCYECHIQPDWLLVYILDNKVNTVTFVRTGTHADLF